MTDEIRRLSNEQPWDFIKAGSYGSFSTAASLPIEYIQTTFAASELAYITFAKDVEPDQLDFEMLMQRDIDEDRANRKLKEYLNPQPLASTPSSWHQVFFPPLLLACVPSEHKTVHSHYPDEVWERPKTDRLMRRWGAMFQIEYFTTRSVGELYEIACPSSDERESVDRNNVLVRFNLSHALEEGVKLVAIDGQHRLFALNRLAEQDRDTVARLVIPTCILFSTSATRGTMTHRNKANSQLLLPNVPETFRKIFVDVNSKVEPVGAHTNILLNDTNVGSLIVRDFCGLVNEKEGKEGLSCVEWNIRSIKDSTTISRKHSITSIGILYKALEECFGTRRDPLALLRRLLDIEDAETDSRLRSLADDPEKPDVAWDEFSVAQRPILTQRARHGVASVLYDLFFKSTPYAKSFDHYKEALAELHRRGQENTEQAHEYLRAHKTITNFEMPRRDDAEFRRVRTLGQDEDKWRKSEISRVMGHALFQRAIILTLRELMEALPDLGIATIDPGFKCLLREAMNPDGGVFEPRNEYTLRSIWTDTGNIVNRDNTRRQLARLMLGLLGAPEHASAVVSAIGLPEEELGSAVDRLVDLGEGQIQAFWRDFTNERERHFKRTYLTNRGLGQDDIDGLRRAEAEQEQEKTEIQAGRLTEDAAERPFDKFVRRHLADDFDAAEMKLRDVLGLEKHIIRANVIDEDDDEDE